MKTSIKTRVIWYAIFGIFGLMMLYPIFFAVSNSFKTLSDAINTVLELIPRAPTLDNYRFLFGRMDIFRITGNTFFIAVAVTLFKLATSLFAAYALVFFDFRFKNLVYFILISTIFIPFTVTMIPNFLTISRLDLVDDPIGVILPQLADALGIFLMRQSMRMIPKSLIEYARMENLGHMRILKDIVMPLIKPAIISTSIIFFINAWNEFVWPMLILRSTENFTLPLALQMFISAEGGSDFTYAMAISVLSMIVPLALFFIFQKHIISTFISSGIKG
jgi:sn-glycerol 3-phosphate transport system permease protein